MGITMEAVHNYRGKKNKVGLYSIHLRVTINRERRYYKIKTPQKVSLEQWSGKGDAWVNTTHIYSFEINDLIIQKKTIVTDLVRRFTLFGKAVTLCDVDREMNKRGGRNVLNDYIQNYIERPPVHKDLDLATWEKYRAFLKHLNNFQPQILFSEVNEDLIARFRNYLSNLKGQNGKLDPATIKSYFDKFKVVLKYAARKESLLHLQDVESYFEDVKITIPKRKEGLHLEIEDILQRAFDFME